MTEKNKSQGQREVRRAASLRENLKRRKAQARSRAADSPARPGEKPAQAPSGAGLSPQSDGDLER
jgi:hypothetical protein